MDDVFDPSLLRSVTQLLERLEDMPFHEIDVMHRENYRGVLTRAHVAPGTEYPRLLIEIRGSPHSRKILVKKIELEEEPEIELV